MEDLDIAAERTELERESLLRAIQRRPGSGLLPVGKCHYCDEVVLGQRLFCNNWCTEDYEYARRRGVR